MFLFALKSYLVVFGIVFSIALVIRVSYRIYRRNGCNLEVQDILNAIVQFWSMDCVTLIKVLPVTLIIESIFTVKTVLCFIILTALNISMITTVCPTILLSLWVGGPKGYAKWAFHAMKRLFLGMYLWILWEDYLPGSVEACARIQVITRLKSVKPDFSLADFAPTPILASSATTWTTDDLMMALLKVQVDQGCCTEESGSDEAWDMLEPGSPFLMTPPSPFIPERSILVMTKP